VRESAATGYRPAIAFIASTAAGFSSRHGPHDSSVSFQVIHSAVSGVGSYGGLPLLHLLHT
jgi:hypothetical protein